MDSAVARELRMEQTGQLRLCMWHVLVLRCIGRWIAGWKNWKPSRFIFFEVDHGVCGVPCVPDPNRNRGGGAGMTELSLRNGFLR